MKKRNINLLFSIATASMLSIIVVFLNSCANVKPITGGPKDIAPPTIEAVTPPNGSTNFNNYTVVYSFDEFIALRNFNQEVIINPYVDPLDIKTTVRGKKLFVELPKTLEKNTTYSISFGNSLTDITEYNPNKELNYVFSTGEVLDTIAINGKLKYNASTNPMQEMVIGLYPTNDTINPVEDKPTYYTKSVADSFQINNLPNKEYQLFAFTDLDKNLLYDSLKEQIAFLNHSVYTTNPDTIQLTVFKEATQAFNFARPTYQENFVEVKFTKGIKTLTCADQHLYLQNSKVLRIYPEDNKETMSFVAIDSFGTTIDTTFTVFESTASFKDSTVAIKQDLSHGTDKPFEGLKITAEHKFLDYTTDSIRVVLNSDTTLLSQSSIKHSIEDNVILFLTNNPTDTLAVIIPTNAITFYGGHYNRELIAVKYPTDKSNYGQITGTIETTEPHYIVYLLDAQNNIVDQQKNMKQIDYQYVKAGKYQIKILIDANNNDTFDTGDLQTKRQPESYYIHPVTIDVKNNWEVGNINITF